MFHRIKEFTGELELFLSNCGRTVPKGLGRRILPLFFCFSLLFGLFCLRAVHQPPKVIGWHVRVVESWVTKGFWRTGGLTVFQGKNDPSERWVYKTHTPVVNYPMYVLQKIIYGVRGKMSMTFWHRYNFALYVISGSLIGFIAFLLATSCFALEGRYRLIIGLCASAVYLSHPIVYAAVTVMNLEHVTTMIILPLLAAYTLRTRLYGLEAENINAGGRPVAALMAVMTAVNPPMAVCYAGSAALFGLVSGAAPADRRDLVKQYILPVIVVFILVKAHIWLGAHLLDGITGTTGSGFRFRSGLDGAVDVMKDGYLSIFLDRLPRPGPHMIRWTGFFFLGALAMAFSLVAACRSAEMRLYCASVLPLALLAVIYFFVFAQGAIIHPLYYDLLIIIPFIHSFFWLAGKSLSWARVKAVPAYLLVAVSIIFVMMHLRLYALDRPFPAYNWSLNATLYPI